MGVFIPCLQNILGIIYYIRFSWYYIYLFELTNYLYLPWLKVEIKIPLNYSSIDIIHKKVWK